VETALLSCGPVRLERGRENLRLEIDVVANRVTYPPQPCWRKWDYRLLSFLVSFLIFFINPFNDRNIGIEHIDEPEALGSYFQLHLFGGPAPTGGEARMKKCDTSHLLCFTSPATNGSRNS